MFFSSRTFTFIAISTAFVSPFTSIKIQNYKDIYDWSCDESIPVSSSESDVEQMHSKADDVSDSQIMKQYPIAPTVDQSEEKVTKVDPIIHEMDSETTHQAAAPTDESFTEISDEQNADNESKDVKFPDFGMSDKRNYDDQALSGATHATLAFSFIIVLLF